MLTIDHDKVENLSTYEYPYILNLENEDKQYKSIVITQPGSQGSDPQRVKITVSQLEQFISDINSLLKNKT